MSHAISLHLPGVPSVAPARIGPIFAAVVGSLLAHALLIAFVPGFRMPEAEQLPRMEVVLAPAPVPVPVAKPQVALPEPPRAVPPPERKPKPRPAPVAAPKPAPAPVEKVVEPAPLPPVAEAVPVAPPPSVAPAPVAPPPPVARVAPPPRPEPEVIDPNLLAGYGKTLSGVIGQHRKYPRIAQMRGWQGTVQVAIRVAPNRQLVSVAVQHSSGFEVLDAQALEMVRSAGPLPEVPQGLRGRELSITVPITFKLES